MKTGLIHLCFVIDESGSMSGSESDVCSGFNKLIAEQKAVQDGECLVSLYRFETTVKKDFVGKNVNEIGEMKPGGGLYTIFNNSSLTSQSSYKLDNPINENDLSYGPGGMTAMNDGIGTAIDEIGKWLNAMPEEERPEKNLIVIITDGEENSSREYTIEKIKDMIKHQTEKYDWSFIYMGTDVTNTSYANSIGVKGSYTSRSNHMSNYAVVNDVTTAYRCSTADHSFKNATLNSQLNENMDNLTSEYEATIGININGQS